MTDLLEAALAYAETGWQVFPLRRDKSPAFRSPHADVAERKACRGRCGRDGHGFYDATSDEDKIRQWWTEQPDLLVAGRVPAHLFMLDVDPRGGGQVTLNKLQAEYGPLPGTLACMSGRGDGGCHLYFVRPSGAQLTDHRLAGVDLCHHGLRYGVLPPSPHPVTGRPYYWADDSVAIAHPPAWLMRLMEPKLQPVVRTGRYTSTRPSGSAGSIAAWLAGQSSDPGSGRHSAVLWALCRAYEKGADQQTIEAIKDAATTLGKPVDEVESMAAWAADEYRSSSR
jgi:hypothetical protein